MLVPRFYIPDYTNYLKIIQNVNENIFESICLCILVNLLYVAVTAIANHQTPNVSYFLSCSSYIFYNIFCFSTYHFEDT